jgi:hypothetical protein
MNVPLPQPLQANYRIANVSAVASAMMLIGCFFDVSTSIGFTPLLALAYLRWRRRWMRVSLFCMGLWSLVLWLVTLGFVSYTFGSVDTARTYWEAAVADEPPPLACYILRYGECSGFDIPCSLAGATAFTGPHAQCSDSCGIDNEFLTTCKERMKTLGEWLCRSALLRLASSVLVLMATTWLSSTNAPRTGKSGGWLFWLVALTCSLWYLIGDSFSRLLAGAGLLLAHTRSRQLKYAFLVLTSVYIVIAVNAALEAIKAQCSGHIPDTMSYDLTNTDLDTANMAKDLWTFVEESPEEQVRRFRICQTQDRLCSGYSKPCTSKNALDDSHSLCRYACRKSLYNPSPCRDVMSMLGLVEVYDQKQRLHRIRKRKRYASIVFAVGASLVALFYSCT